MNFEEPEGQKTTHRELAEFSSESDDSSDEESEPSGYIVIRLQIKKTYKNILYEEALIED